MFIEAMIIVIVYMTYVFTTGDCWQDWTFAHLSGSIQELVFIMGLVVIFFLPLVALELVGLI